MSCRISYSPSNSHKRRANRRCKAQRRQVGDLGKLLKSCIGVESSTQYWTANFVPVELSAGPYRRYGLSNHQNSDSHLRNAKLSALFLSDEFEPVLTPTSIDIICLNFAY